MPADSTFTFDTKAFDEALRRYIPTTRKDISTILNERALKILGRTFDNIPPKNVQAERSRVAKYLHEELPGRTGFKTGKTGRRLGKKANRLQRMHLIAQSLFRRNKKRLTRKAVAFAESSDQGPGLYGERMRVVAGAFAGRSIRGVGFLKSILLPAITTLNRVSPWKFPFSKTKNIARWPGSAGYGQVNIALPGNPEVQIKLHHSSGAIDSRGVRIFTEAMAKAFNDEAAELERHIYRKMQAEANKINAK